MRALENIEVIDLTRLAPGPYCTMMLGDLGARVLRVEEFGALTGRRAAQSQGAAVTTSGASGQPEDAGFVDPHSPYNALNRNKRSLGLNLKLEAAREVLYKLAQRADVVVEEFRPGVTKRLGIDYDTLKQINPRIIYCAITGYGQNGPYRDFAGHDLNYISMAGALSIMGRPGEPPMIPANMLADYGASIQAVVGILAAVIAREKTGQGQFIDFSLTDGVLSLLAHMLSWSYATKQVPGQGEHVTTGSRPYYNVYQTKDGKYISIGCMEPWLYGNLCRFLGREDLIPHQFTKDEAKQKEIAQALQQTFLTKTRDEWFDSVSKTEIPLAKVLRFDELADDPQIRARQMIVELTDPTVGNIKQVGISIKLSDTPGQITARGPQVGEHSEQVLLELGYTRDQITSLAQANAVKLAGKDVCSSTACSQQSGI
jgi:alpha-methylacyl-CoA racemase